MVGSSILNKLKDKGFNNILHPTRKELNLYKKTKVMKYLKQNNPEFVLLCAARVGGIAANDQFNHEFLIQNIEIQNNVIYGSHIANIKNLLFLGSSCIYPKFSKQPIKEDSLLTGPLEPTNEWYAIAKIAGLKLCKAYGIQYKKNFISAMPTNLYGPRDNFDVKSGHVLPGLINKIHTAVKQNKKNVTIWGTGKPKREFLFVDDLADALVFLMKKYNKNEHINIGSGEEVSILNLAETIAKVIGFRGKFVFDKSKPNGTPRKFINSKQINSLGWKSKTNLLDGIKLTYESYLKNKSK